MRKVKKYTCQANYLYFASNIDNNCQYKPSQTVFLRKTTSLTVPCLKWIVGPNLMGYQILRPATPPIILYVVIQSFLVFFLRNAQVCRTFRNVCCKDFLWKRLYAKHFGGISPATQNLGWKEAFVMTWKQKTTKGKLVKQQDNTIQDMLEENVKIKLVM